MKIVITLAEVAAIIQARYNLPMDTELEISEFARIDHPIDHKLKASLESNDCLTPTGAIRPDKKIASIKLLRDLVISQFPAEMAGRSNKCGLAQAKYAIEDWDRFYPYVRKYGMPPMGGNDPERGWLAY